MKNGETIGTGHFVATTTITTDTGFMLEFMDDDQQRVLSVSYDDQRQTVMELKQSLPTELYAQLKVIAEKWSAGLELFADAEVTISPSFVADNTLSDGQKSTL